MPVVTELKPMPFSISAYSTEWSYLMDPDWYPSTGVPELESLLDLRNVAVGSGAAIAVKPAIQFAPTRIDRPDAAALIGNGNPLTGNNLGKYVEGLSAASQFYFRRGLAYRVSAGSFARAEGRLYNAFRPLGMILPAEQIVFNPWNDVTDYAVFPLNRGRPIPTNRVDKAKLAVFWMGNANTTMAWRVAVRAFNDPMARGTWTLLQSDYFFPSTVDGDANTGEISLSGITLANYMWVELAFVVRKVQNSDANSKVIFNVIPAFTLT